MKVLSRQKVGKVVRSVVLSLPLALLATDAVAAEEKRLPVTPSTTQQKAKFVASLVGNSAASRTIEQSADAEAKAALAKARSLVEAAGKEVGSGGYQAADTKLNQAVDLVMTHSRRLSEGTVSADRNKQMYEARTATVKAMLDAMERVAEEKGQLGRAREKRAQIQQTLNEADAAVRGGKYDTALVMVDRAYRAVTGEVTAMRDGEKLVKTLKFDTAVDEYIYEIDRNDSHFYLLTLTLSEKTPHESYAAQIEAMRTEARGIRTKAEELAKGNKHQDAIKLLGDSTDKLIRALRMAGAYIPG